MLLGVMSDIKIVTSTQPAISANTIIMLPMDGVNAGTSFPDIAPVPNTFTARGGAQTSTASPKFGSANAILLVAASSYLDCPAFAGLNFGTGNFTIQGWINLSNLTLGDQYICSYGSQAVGQDWGFMFQAPTGNLRVFAETASTVLDLKTGNLNLSTGTWVHVCWERFGSTIYVYLNGVSQSLTGTALGSGSLPNGNGTTFKVGARFAGSPGLFLDGGVDEFRVDNVALYQGVNFTPQTVAFS